jgi:hypothetical protein
MTQNNVNNILFKALLLKGKSHSLSVTEFWHKKLQRQKDSL